MMKKMKHFKPPTQSKSKTSSKPKAKRTKAKKNASKTKKSTTKETEQPEAAEHPHTEPEDPKSPSQEELDEALRKAGVKADNVKLKNMGQKDEMVDEKGRKLKKLNIEKDATQEDIQAAIDEALKGAEEKKEGHSEL
jgi:hypoxia up-regulated 1